MKKKTFLKGAYIKKSAYIKATVFCAGMCLSITACGSKETGEEAVVKVDVSEDEITYHMDEATIGDVILTQNVSCSYVQTEAQEVAFSTGGKIVDKVYVKEGDSVKKGDLLVELQSENIEDEIAELDYNIKRSELQYGYLDTYEEFDLQNAYYNFVYGTKKEEEDLKDYQKTEESIKENYTYQREDYEDNLYFDKKKLDAKRAELDANRVYAAMDGTVIKIKDDLEGSTAKRDDVIMTVVDNSNGLFETEDESVKAFTKADAVLPMVIVYGSAKGEYELAPYNMESWGEKQTFQIVDGPESATLEVGTSGTITATIDQKTSVLRIPREALYEADGKYYTYTLDEDNMRQVRFLEVGLIGDKYVEIVNGLSEAEKVIKK